MDTHKSLFDSDGGGQKWGSRGGCCGAFRTFHVYDNRVSLYPLTRGLGFFSLPSASKIKPGCTMNIVSFLLLLFNFQTVGGKCTDNKCSLHARSLPVLSSVSWNSGYMNLTEAFQASNKHTVQHSL